MIDWARVSELRDEVGAEDFDEVVELFLEEPHLLLFPLSLVLFTNSSFSVSFDSS